MSFIGIIFVPDSNPLSVPFSSKSSQDDGCLASYLLLEELDFNMGRYDQEFDMPDNINGLIFINYHDRHINHEEKSKILSWVHDKGNCLILAGPYETFFDSGEHKDIIKSINENRETSENRGNKTLHYTDISYGNGFIRLLDDQWSFSNNMLKIKGYSKKLVTALWDLNESTIYFYEHRSGNSATTDKEYGFLGAFNLLPIPLRFAVIQIFLALLIHIVFTGQRIGPPVINKKATSRPDNENILGAAALMDRFKLRDMAFGLYVENFISEVSAHLKCHSRDDILSSWTDNSYKHKELLNEVLHYAFDEKKPLNNLKNKEILRLAKAIDLLKRELSYQKKKGR